MDIQEYANALAGIIQKSGEGFDIRVRVCGDGDFGRLVDVGFSNGRLMGHVDFWSSGMIFYGMIDTSREQYNVVDESYMEALDMSWDEIFEKLKPMIDYISENS